MRYLLITFFCLITSLTTNATHNVGADISYKCLGSNVYEFTLSIYVRIGSLGGSVDSIEIRSTNCSVIKKVGLTKVDSFLVSPMCFPQISVCLIGVAGVKKYVYKGYDTLQVCSDWLFSWESFSRAMNISNLTIPSNQSIYIESTLNNTLGCNNSPTFNNTALPAFCIGQCFEYSLPVDELDCDSLGYSLVAVKKSIGTPNGYVGGMDSVNSIDTTGGGFILIDKKGILNICTYVPGNFSVAIKIDEYRNKNKIGSIIKDIPIFIDNCSCSFPSITGIDGTANCTTTVCVDSSICFDVFGSPPDSGVIYSLSWDSGISNANFTVSGNPLIGTFCWTPGDSDVINCYHKFRVTIGDDSCISRMNFRDFFIKVNPLPSVKIVANKDTVCAGETINLSAPGVSDYWWATLSTPQDTIGSNSSLVVNPDTTTTYILTGVDSKLCENKDTFLVYVYPLPLLNTIVVPDTVCGGDTSTLSVSGAKDYWWTLKTTPLDTIGAGSSISVAYDTSQYFIVTGTDSLGCMNRDTVLLIVNPKAIIDTIYGSPFICPHDDSIDYRVQNTVGSFYTWNVSGGILTTGQGTDNIKVAWDSAGIGFVQVVETTAYGCKTDTINFPVNINVLWTPPPPAGPDSICWFDRDTIIFSAIYTFGARYYWHIQGGTILSGDSTWQIVVRWDSLATGYLTYDEENITIDTICFNPSDTLWVTINPNPKPKPISGDFRLCVNDSGFNYSVSDSGDEGVSLHKRSPPVGRLGGRHSEIPAEGSGSYPVRTLGQAASQGRPRIFGNGQDAGLRSD
ncbi:MAG: hypothetical protein IIA45_13755, partial [Bacteroidetes bacterium]|nr:hypothetical protein [Bacteroidota bacterium]